MLNTRPETDGSITVVLSRKTGPGGNTGRSASHSRLAQRRMARAGELLAALQTTLDLEPLLRIFSREINGEVPHSSLSYRHEAREIDLTVGRAARHSSTYRLIAENQDLGELVFTRGRAFSGADASRLQPLISVLVYPLRNALTYRRALQASLTDPLTGFFNRKYLDRALRREAGLARRHGTPLSLAVFDIDGFKAINDEHGHTAGDAILRTLADSVSECLRETDILARYGGDEFTVLLSNTRRKGAAVVASHIQEKLAATRFRVGEEELKVTVSIGVASLLKRDVGTDLFTRADGALYRAKRAGTGRIGVASGRDCRILERL